MTRHEFVDKFRGKDDRDKNRHLRRVIPRASFGDIISCVIYILCIIMIIASLGFIILACCTHQWAYLWFGILAPVGAGIMIAATSMLGDAKFEHVPLTVEELRTYSGKHLYIHWLNNVTGYEDGWFPFYGATEEFVRCNQLRPEICVAPFEQYQRGWIAYAHKLSPEDFKTKG